MGNCYNKYNILIETQMKDDFFIWVKSLLSIFFLMNYLNILHKPITTVCASLSGAYASDTIELFIQYSHHMHHNNHHRQ